MNTGKSFVASGQGSVPRAPDSGDTALGALQQFESSLRAARAAHRVKSGLPRVFNPVFRDQGAVNRHLLDALNRIGEEVRRIGHESVARDALIRQIHGRLDAHSERLDRIDTAVAQAHDSAARHLSGLASAVRATDLRATTESQALRTDIATLYTSTNAGRKLVNELLQKSEETSAALNSSLKNWGDQFLQTKDSLESALAVAGALLDEKVAHHNTLLDGLASRDAALSEVLRAEVDEKIAAVTARLSAQFKDTQSEALQGVHKRIDELSTVISQAVQELARPEEPATQPTTPAVVAQLTELQAALGSLQALGRAADIDLLSLGDVAGKHLAATEDLRERVSAMECSREKDATPASFHAFYRDFEAKFRGSQDLIRQRVVRYVEPVANAIARTKAATPKAPLASSSVLDLGCGRGEWLEVLRERAIAVLGVDTNPIFVRDCAALGLEVQQGDALEKLRSLPGGSLAAITSFHMVEHLPFVQVIDLLNEAFRALAPGGVLILETPNPQNLLVATGEFRLDPTHNQPLPPRLLEFTAQHTGFNPVKIVPANPYPSSMLLAGREDIIGRWNEAFYGPQDYAVIAEKPLASP